MWSRAKLVLLRAVIELHVPLLELNFLSQVRALPNPAFTPPKGSSSNGHSAHPLALHLSPTTTANVVVASVTPAPAANSPFVKIAPNAEVSVAPKLRQPAVPGAGRDSRSGGGASKVSTGGESSASTARRRIAKCEPAGQDAGRGAVFLRGVDRTMARRWFDDDGSAHHGLTVWVDSQISASEALRGITWVSVSILKPVGHHQPPDPQRTQDSDKVAVRLVAKLQTWKDAPDNQHIALSTDLCTALGITGMIGGIVRVEAAPDQVGKCSTSTPIRGMQEGTINGIKLFPFSSASPPSRSALRLSGGSKQKLEATLQFVKCIYGKPPDGNGLFEGPVTDGMLLPAAALVPDTTWQGGILRFVPPQQTIVPQLSWVLLAESKLPLELAAEIPMPVTSLESAPLGELLPQECVELVGVDTLVHQLSSHLKRHSSVLLTGGPGSGKTSVAHLIAHQLRSHHLFHVVNFPCRKLVTGEMPVSAIKERFRQLFSSAAWSAREEQSAVVVLDDLDRLCPVETELQVGGENGRSRHVSENVVSIVRQHCSVESGVVLLATAQDRGTVHEVVTGSHVLREIVGLKAPDKNGRRALLEMLAHRDTTKRASCIADGLGSRPGSRPSASDEPGPESNGEGLAVHPTTDFLDIAGQTDGYLPGDLVVLVSRARGEAVIRTMAAPAPSLPVALIKEDFALALSGFRPASLWNVTLQSSTTRWDAIGGLHAARQTLLETLQYPTTYAPIFAQCPLRLRSGLLLYGFPGCGKTLLASAVAGECGLNFVSVKGPEILNKYIGASEKAVRDLFERAEAARPCVLFFDEFDSIAPKRGHDSTGVTDRVVNQLLTQMDGAEGPVGRLCTSGDESAGPHRSSPSAAGPPG